MGRDKARITTDGVSLLKQMIQKGERHFDNVVLLSGDNTYDVPNRQLQDWFSDAGPLGGILAALEDCERAGMTQCCIVPVDLPAIFDSTLKLLADTDLREDEDARVLTSSEGIQPLAGVYSAVCNDRLQDYLKTGNRMVFGFLNRLNYSTITVSNSELKNVNTPDDLEN